MGPCLCGDPYCSSCGNPSLARYEDLCYEMQEKATPVFPFLHSMIDHEYLLGYIVTNLLDVKARPFITALYEEVKRQEKEEDDERRYAEQLAEDERYEEEYRKGVEETDNALRNWGKM